MLYGGKLWISAIQQYGKNEVFFEPAGRQDFDNALGQNCIHDLRLVIYTYSIRCATSICDGILITYKVHS